MSCSLCERVHKIKRKEYPYLIQEFEHSYWILGEHQYFEGYSLILAKVHYREMHDMPASVATAIYQDLTLASRVIQEIFQPKKMNLCSLGNVVDHVHWHLFPRYEADPHFFKPPWLQMDHFSDKNINPIEAEKIIKMMNVKI